MEKPGDVHGRGRHGLDPDLYRGQAAGRRARRASLICWPWTSGWWRRCCSPTSPPPLPKPGARPRPTPCGKTRAVDPALGAPTTDGSHGDRPSPLTCSSGDAWWSWRARSIPSDGEIIEGVASIDESAITGESAPVIREAGGDRSGVTGGTRVLSDRIVVRNHRQSPARRSWTA